MFFFRSLSETLRGRETMYSSVFEQAVLLIGAGAACLAAIFAILSYFRSHQPTDFLTATGAAQLLRSETEIVRASIDDHHARGRGCRAEHLIGSCRGRCGANDNIPIRKP